MFGKQVNKSQISCCCCFLIIMTHCKTVLNQVPCIICILLFFILSTSMFNYSFDVARQINTSL